MMTAVSVMLAAKASSCYQHSRPPGPAQPPPLAGTPHPAFNSLIYTLDLLIPIVNFGLRNTYDPHGTERWLVYALISASWIFATTIAAGVVRVLRRQ